MRLLHWQSFRDDAQLLDQCPPHDFSQTPRSIANHRKALEDKWIQELASVLLFATPCFYKYATPLSSSFCILVCSIHILLQPTLTETQIKAAEEMLQDYYLLLPDLYGISSCTLNAHSLSHLSLYARIWGPLWVYSFLWIRKFKWAW